MLDESAPSPSENPAPVQSRMLARNAGDRALHGFFTREGGVSSGIYRGLNVGVGSNDHREHVLENRRRVAAWFGQTPDTLATLHQVHSADVITVTGSNTGERPKADAMVTNIPGILLGVLSADCGPVLFCDGDNGVIGAAHAGWKGAVTGVLEATIDAMVLLGAARSNIVASLGPSISRDSYEVGPEFVARFIEADAAYAAFFTPSRRANHSMFDLPSFTVKRLRDAGVSADNLDLCTYRDPDRFFSYRRTTHAGEPDYGRQISAITLVDTHAGGSNGTAL